MPWRSGTIRSQLMRMGLLTSGAVLVLTTASLFAYDAFSFRQTLRQQLDTLGRAIANNSTAALAFANPEDARDVLEAFSADPHIVAAALYDPSGALFAVYPNPGAARDLPRTFHESPTSYSHEGPWLTGVQPVSQAGKRLGTLLVRSDLRAIRARERIYLGIVTLVSAASALLAYALAQQLQRRVSGPILQLASTATAVSTGKDYSVRAPVTNAYELDQLTNAFNHMLTEIERSESRLRLQIAHLSLLQHITRAISDHQDLASIFQVVLRSLEESLAIEFACLCRYDSATNTMVIGTVGPASNRLRESLALFEGTSLDIAASGLARTIDGHLIYERDSSTVACPLFAQLAAGGMRSVVIAPLRAGSLPFGALILTRRAADAFSVAECDFVSQLSDHVALASQQAQLYGALQQAYDDLHQSQRTVMQQERLRALGQIASGIAHDINNAISPIGLYTESLLEREPNLSERTRTYLTTIQRAIEDVAGTVARMREFYRQREPQLNLARVNLNRTIEQALELTRARWSDLPQQRGVMVEVCKVFAEPPVEVMAAEGEIRDALTNLIFNAVDAMPEGGRLTLCTRVVDTLDPPGPPRVLLEVSDSGIGMDDATRMRCLEPFFTTKGERGSGLGLAMVYGMVQRHSAELEIDSEPGRGSTFRLIFASAPEEKVASVYIPAARPVSARLNVLLVDDDPLVLASLGEILRTDGHAVTATDGGQAGIDAFTAPVSAGSAFDLVITDLGMPYVDGRRVAAAIKAVSPTTPVIMLTGWGHRLLAENDVPPHVDRLLNKPPRLHELRATLAELAPRPAAVERRATTRG